MRDRVESNRRYYDKTRRKVHAANGLIAMCNQRGPVGREVTCKTCLQILKFRAVGTRMNEWEAKRIAELARQKSVEKSRAWRAANREKAREACRRWRERNKDLQRINNREWAAKNREHRRAYNARYYANRRLSRDELRA